MSYGMDGWNKPGGDLISRAEAIDALDVLCQEHRYKIPGKGETYSQYNEAWQDALDRAEGAIFNLPSAQPERKTGRWIIKDNPGIGWYRVTCSECGEDVASTAQCTGFYPNAKVTWDYCPNCGADMREVDDERSD